MARAAPVTPLHRQLESFGRRGRKLSSARLLEFDELLTLLGEADRLTDITYRQELSDRVVSVIESEIASMKDPVDRRIAEVVLAAAPEFYDKFVGERLAVVAIHDRTFTPEQFKTHRRRVLADVAAALQKRFQVGSTATETGPGAPHDRLVGIEALRSLPRFTEHSSPGRQPWMRRPETGRGRRLARTSAVLIVGVIAAVVAGFGLEWWSISTPSQPDAATLATAFDNQDPRNLAGDPCVDAPQSQPAYPAGPEVIGPDETVVGTIQLRTQYSCEVVWPRIVWDVGPDLDMEATYQIPSDWTLHVLTVRPATGSTFDYPEPASGAPVPYALGKMASTVPGCIYVEVYFANGTQETPHARTECVVP